MVVQACVTRTIEDFDSLSDGSIGGMTSDYASWLDSGCCCTVAGGIMRSGSQWSAQVEYATLLTPFTLVATGTEHLYMTAKALSGGGNIGQSGQTA